MTRKSPAPHTIEILEQRIAPAGLINEAGFKPGTVGTPLLLHAGEGLTTGIGAGSGNYLLFIEKGEAYVFTTDLNNNTVIDFNEITGIAAGDGLRLISFVDIHGDIVTNLNANATLSDSDNVPDPDATNVLRGDGRVLRNSTIEKIELRSVTNLDFAPTPLNDQNGDGLVDDTYITDRLVLSSYSIYGNILAGKGFGVAGDATSGLIIDITGKLLQQITFTPGNTNPDYFIDFTPSIGSIKTGTAASGEYFSFGISKPHLSNSGKLLGDDIQGRLSRFLPPAGQDGGDIVGLRAAATTTQFNINSLEAGDGGISGHGGDILDIRLNRDTVGGYRIIAGNGGRGPNGGSGGAITNFVDLGSITSRVLLQTGNGGEGTTGVGGGGGAVTLGTMNLSAGLHIVLGDGGKGFIGGGNGASFPKAVITTPEGAVPFGASLVGLATDPSRTTISQGGDGIGTTIPIDINEDGIGDFVYTSLAPDQLVVVLGSPNAAATGNPFVWALDSIGNPIYNKIFLDGTAGATGLVVGDFNADGHQDIAVASQTDGAFDGITVFLNRFEDLNGNNSLDAGEDLNANRINDFVGFESGRHSVLPSLYSGDPAFNLVFGFRRAAVNVSDIAAGDFDGDGFTDIAVVATYYGAGLPVPNQVLLFMTNDVEDGKPTGQFYADFGTRKTSSVPADLKIPFQTVRFFPNGTPGTVIIEATELSDGDGIDAVVLGQLPSLVGATRGSLEIYDFSGSTVSQIGFGLLGQVDTDRLLTAGNNNHVALADATLKDFTILDFNDDGNADIAALTESPAGFLVVMAGNGNGGFTITTNALVGGGPNGQNFGIFFGTPTSANAGFGVGTQIAGIRAADVDGDGIANDILAQNYSHGNNQTLELVTLDPAHAGTTVNNQGGDSFNSLLGNFASARVASIVAFDSVAVDVANRSFIYGGAQPTRIADTFFSSIEFPRDLGPSWLVHFADNAVIVLPGDGGSSSIGKGGNGGSIGNGTVSLLTATTITASVNITIPMNPAYDADIILTSGRGGNGFSTGGDGGSIMGVGLRYATGASILSSFASLTAGDGGFGVAGAGGRGGSILSNSIQRGEIFRAGDGGRGLLGGDGGSVRGNGVKGLYDSLDLDVQVDAGTGGAGVRRGGNGGDVSGFAVQFIGATGFAGGQYQIVAGAGGNAVSGPGGRGGSVAANSPLPGENRLAGEIYLQGGNGGLGLSGGAGGSVTDFQDRPSQLDNPTILSIIAGNGGNGISGSGGAGGNVTSVIIPSTGTPGLVVLSGYQFDRIIAGDGGSSAGSTGGDGGRVSNVNVSASDGPLAIVGGAGGVGLFHGGTGGSVVDVTGAVGGNDAAKVLVIAGAGGDAHAFIPNPLDLSQSPTGSQAESLLKQQQKAFGGRIGIGGAGGNIISFNQALAVSARVDLIAGNGGSTVNYGTVADTKSFVGRGGSIIDTNIAGSIGNLANDIAIKGYNDLNNDGRADQTIAQFVQDNLRRIPADALINPPPLLDDSFGNVGIVVGSAGRIKALQVSPGVVASLPATFALNGYLTNITARNLMSAVAGDVGLIAAIQVASGLKIGTGTGVNFTPGVIGSDKDPTLPGLDYLDSNGNDRDPNGQKIEPLLDGRLVDGALVYKTLVGQVSGRVYRR